MAGEFEFELIDLKLGLVLIPFKSNPVLILINVCSIGAIRVRNEVNRTRELCEQGNLEA